MKQVTGNNTQQSIDKVSIQLALNGHSFSISTGLDTIPSNTPVEVEVLTPRTLLVPELMFEAACCTDLLAAAGVAPHPDEETVYSHPGNGTVAVMAIPSEARQTIEKTLGIRARYTTPLLTVPTKSDSLVWICYKAGLLYIKVYDGTLQFAEVIPAAGEADIRYFFERLGSEFSLKTCDLVIAADTNKMIRKAAGKLFKQIVCE